MTNQQQNPHPNPQLPPEAVGGGLSITAVAVGAILWNKILEPWWTRTRGYWMRSTTIDDDIDAKLQTLRGVCNASRALIMEFGQVVGKTNTGSNIPIASITYEAAEMGLSRIRGITMNDPRCVESCISSLKGENFQIREVSNLPNGSYKGTMLNWNCHYAIYYFLEDRGVPIGFIALHFPYERYADFTASQQLEDLIKESGCSVLALLSTKSPISNFLERFK